MTEAFIEECVKYYREKYGLFCEVNNYMVYFEPLGIFEKF